MAGYINYRAAGFLPDFSVNLNHSPIIHCPKVLKVYDSFMIIHYKFLKINDFRLEASHR